MLTISTATLCERPFLNVHFWPWNYQPHATDSSNLMILHFMCHLIYALDVIGKSWMCGRQDHVKQGRQHSQKSISGINCTL